MFVGIGLAPFLLESMGTPEDVLGLSVVYLRIYFAGIIANLVYNVGAAILRAVGDSKRPLYFLAASCMVNIALDIVLVVFFRLGVVGAAIATILSQLFSAFLVVVCLIRTKDMHRLVLRELRLDGADAEAHHPHRPSGGHAVCDVWPFQCHYPVGHQFAWNQHGGGVGGIQ